jgi:uncharacterized NAD-dependent epimerase/dehydratase family protein
MTGGPEGNAIVYCRGAFATTNGKTAHGLVRRTSRYRVLSVVDERLAGKDAGLVLDGRPNGIPVFDTISAAVAAAQKAGTPATHMVVGLAPDGGRLTPEGRADVLEAIGAGLNVDCGLHDFLSEDAEIARQAADRGVRIRDVRKTPPRSELHAFSGKIEQVRSLKVAVLGTDSAVGKRTTAWKIVDAARDRGRTAEMVGTGQTAWLQGARYSTMVDSLVSDFMAGEIEHAVWSAWNDLHPEVIVLEGQGSLMNPAYPGGYELLAAGRPDVVVLQHAPARREYDGFPGYPIHSLEVQIQAIELVSSKPVVAITINHEDLSDQELEAACRGIREQTGLPTVDVLREGASAVVDVLPFRE